MHALSARSQGCYWCQSDAHRLFDCSLAKAAVQDPHKSSLIRRFMDGLKSPSTSSTKAVRQLQVDELEAGEGCDEDPSTEPASEPPEEPDPSSDSDDSGPDFL